MPFRRYQAEDSVCLLVCFGCACALVGLVRGKVKATYRHGDEERCLTAISPNHLDVRDTVSTEWLHYQTNTRMHTHIWLPLGPLR